MIPKQLKYGDKVNSAMAQSYRTNIQPQNGTGPYLVGQTIIINIPTQNNIVLAPTESYLKFSVALTNGGTANANAIYDSCGAHGLIQRLRIFHGSNLLQDIDNYGLLAKMLFDLQVPTDACYGRFNELVGTRNDLISTFSAAQGAAGASISANQINSGESYTLGAANAAQAAKRYFCLNLISLIGTLSPAQYIPLFAMTSAPLRLEIQLVSDIKYAIASTAALNAAPLAFSDVEYIANFIKLSDGVMNQIYSSLNGQPLEFALSDYSNYQFTSTAIAANNPTTINFAIPAKYSSLKSIFCTIRDRFPNADTYFPFSSVTCGVTSYYFRIGSQIMPTKAPDNLPEMFSEVLKAMGSMSDLNYHPSIEKFSFELAASVAITAANYNTISS